ncbi:hypothetical protein mRhiFer1_009205 [Rhinolophus ferrumequinum]|uniref:Uncharacterized protein n=1 Tax=Rhinolophus ferrumequinum TaxID=59479 RepID=A0A7J7SJA8_RHIFE|nr:hypothetical protein mRhiFer1_009205 [Rhinolophus ferrumequinum]
MSVVTECDADRILEDLSRWEAMPHLSPTEGRCPRPSPPSSGWPDLSAATVTLRGGPLRRKDDSFHHQVKNAPRPLQHGLPPLLPRWTQEASDQHAPADSRAPGLDGQHLLSPALFGCIACK